jgi:cysteine desulfurase
MAKNIKFIVINMNSFYIFILIILLILVIFIFYKMLNNDKYVYLDNNATTIPPEKVGNFMSNWLYCGNPSASYQSANAAKKLIENTKKYIYDVCETNDTKYSIIFNSGASEGNSFIIRASIESYYAKFKSKCHIITSSIEHKSIITCLNNLSNAGLVDVTYINPNIYGIVKVDNIENSIRKNTILISIMYANNEIGSINPISDIGKLCNKYKIPFHCDIVQAFGKYKINLEDLNINIATLSFHKLYGPAGIGACIINNDFTSGYGIKAQICGSQMGNLRGGTENIIGIAGSLAAMKYNFSNRNKKNEKLIKLRNSIYYALEKEFDEGIIENYTEYSKSTELVKPFEFVLIGPNINSNERLPNTLLIAFCKNVEDKDEMFCNTKLKDELYKRGHIISIGSACNTQSDKASHIISNMKLNLIIRRGVVRISLGDNNKSKEIKEFIKNLIECIKLQL